MDVINHLSRTVTPAVLSDDQSPQKKSLLEQFYAIFAARLSDKDAYKHLSEQEVARDDLGFYDRFWSDETHRSTVTKELAGSHDVDESTAQSLVATAAPLAYHEINSLAGDTPVPQFLTDNASSFQPHLPSWSKAMIPAGLLATNVTDGRISDTVSAAPLHREEKEGGSFMKALLPIIGLIIFGALAWALLRGCQENPEPVATPAAVVEETVVEEPAALVANEDVEAASLRLATGEGNTLYACRITAGNDSLNASIISSMKSVFGDETAKCRSDIDDDFATVMPADESLAAILPLVKAVDNASILIKGNDIIVNAPDSDALAKLIADIQAAAPNMNVTAEKPLDLQNAVQDSLNAADTAINNLGDNPDPHDVARALSLQVINFDVDKSEIPEVNKAFLNKAVQVIEQVPDMKLMITGHTDSQGSDSYNEKLSQERADSVKNYLVSQGVDANKLATKGKGETDPIADNSTEQGRFYNRRIEFTVFDDNQMTGDGIAVADTVVDNNAEDSTLVSTEEDTAENNTAEKTDANNTDANNNE